MPIINEERLNEAEEELMKVADSLDYYYPRLEETIKEVFAELRKVEVDVIDTAD